MVGWICAHLSCAASTKEISSQIWRKNVPQIPKHQIVKLESDGKCMKMHENASTVRLVENLAEDRGDLQFLATFTDNLPTS